MTTEFAPAPPPVADLANPGRVLLIDDDESICSLVSKYLQHHGFSVEVQHEGKDIERMHQIFGLGGT